MEEKGKAIEKVAKKLKTSKNMNQIAQKVEELKDTSNKTKLKINFLTFLELFLKKP